METALLPAEIAVLGHTPLRSGEPGEIRTGGGVPHYAQRAKGPPYSSAPVQQSTLQPRAQTVDSTAQALTGRRWRRGAFWEL